MTPSYSFAAELWLYPGEAGWHFITLPPEVADEIADHSTGSKAFGSVKVTADISGHTWQTSIFPDNKLGSYLLPVKKAVREKAKISAGDTLAVRLEIELDSNPHEES